MPQERGELRTMTSRRGWRRSGLVAVLVGALVVSGLLPATAQVPPVMAPPNDNFADAEPIAGARGSTEAEMLGATEQANEPEHTNNDFKAYDPTEPDPSVWFRWVAPKAGWYRLDVGPQDGDCSCGPSAVSVYRGNALTALSRVSHWSNGILVDEDDAEFYEADDTVFMFATAGTSYAVAVATVQSSFAGVEQPETYRLSWKPEAPDLIARVSLPDGRPARGWDISVDIPWERLPGGSWPRAVVDASGFVYFDLEPGEHRFEAFPIDYSSSPSPNIANGRRTITIPADDDPLRVSWRLKATPALDIDGDTRGDIVAGMPHADRGAGNSGAVLIRFGNGRRRLLFQGGLGVPGPALRGERFGASVQTEDVNHDNRVDLVIGAPGEMINGVRAGAIFVVFGSPDGFGRGRATLRFHQNSPGVPGRNWPGDGFGAALQVRTGPYWTNFLVGAPGKAVQGAEGAGMVAYFPSLRTSSRQTPSPILWSQDTPGVGGSSVAGDRFGSALAMVRFYLQKVGLVVGVPGKNASGAPGAGAIVVLREFDEQGGSYPLVHQDSDEVPGDGREAGDAFGSALTRLSVSCGAMELLAVGAPGDGGGVVHVLEANFRRPRGFEPRERNRIFRQGTGVVPGASEAGDRFGNALGGGDFVGDGADDLVIGAPGEAVSGAARAGAATVVELVATDSDDEDYSCNWVPVRGTRLSAGSPGVRGVPRAGARFGAAVLAMDVNGDGHPDVVAGVPGDDVAATNAGALVTAQRGAGGFSEATGLHVTAPGAVAGDSLGTVFGHRGWVAHY